MQTLTFPTESPSLFELPEAGMLELTFAANRPVAPPAWKEKHVRAALKKVRQRTNTAVCTSCKFCVACWSSAWNSPRRAIKRPSKQQERHPFERDSGQLASLKLFDDPKCTPFSVPC